jgi:hypothetical protein
MIREQQATIQDLQNQNTPGNPSASAVDDSTPTSERSISLHNPFMPVPPTTQAAVPASTSTASAPRPRSPFVPHTISRNSSHRSGRSSHEASPVRDESAYFQAETQTLIRENQMLKHRIRELGMITYTCIT